MKTAIIRLLAALLILGSQPALAAAPVPQWDNNGDAAFARQVVPILLGRKAKGTQEVNLLVDLIDLHGREAVVRMLMEQPGFITQWGGIVTDLLKAQRGNDGSRLQSAACFNEPSGQGGGQGGGQGAGVTEAGAPPSAGQLAVFVRDGNPLTQSYQHEFNMHELIASALAIGDLRPVYRAYLWVLASTPPGSGMRSEAERRAEVGVAFDDIYLDRNMECMSCHRGTYSTTGVGQRTHPLYKTLDLAMFDHTSNGEIPVIDNADYAASCKGCHGVDARGGSARGIRDMGADAIKANLLSPQDGMPQFTDLANNETKLNALVAALNGAFGQEYLAETALLHNGVFRTDLFEGEDDENPPGMKAPFGMNPQCARIQTGADWQGNMQTFFAGLSDQYDASTIEVDHDFVDGYNALGASLGSLPTWDEQNAIPGHIGFAYMVAAKITSNVWEQIMGERLTIANQFARNQSQMTMHRYLTEDVFIASDWSLKELIGAILETRFFNRRAPEESVLASAYSMQALFDPFNVAKLPCTDVDPGRGPVTIDPVYTNDIPEPRGTPEMSPFATCAYNSAGDVVHRYSPRTLLTSVGAALDFPAPVAFPAGDYPDLDLNIAIGQYISDFQPGTKDVGFQALLAWDEQFGRCESPAGSQDWITRLVAAVDTYNASSEQPLELRDVVLTVKDWLLQEPFLGGDTPPGGWDLPEAIPEPPPPSPGQVYQAPGQPPPPPPPIGNVAIAPVPDYEAATEVELLETLFGLDIGDPVSSATFDAPAQETSKLRLLCGSYLKTPQFMLAGLVRNETFEPPVLRVCNDAVCSYKQMCEAYEPALDDVGFPTVCNTGSVGKPLGKVWTSNPSPRDDDPRDPGAFATTRNVVVEPPPAQFQLKTLR